MLDDSALCKFTIDIDIDIAGRDTRELVAAVG